MGKKSSGGTPATVALARAGIVHTVHAYTHDSRAASYGEEAADALGVGAERVFKTLLVAADGNLAVGVVPVSGQLDLKAIARALGRAKAVMADPAQAERSSGYVTGGISPIGQRRALPTVVDASALEHPTVFVSAGRRGLEVELSPQDLIAVTEARTAAIGRS
ncbi:Cys-tRNA(Pro) deacylase [Nocardioides pacificus]